jgi:tripartite-type tricarboxylate transporter receptor subunit TctC
MTGAQAVARADPDGHTLLLGGTSNAISAALYKKPGYDPVRDFAPIVPLAIESDALLINNALRSAELGASLAKLGLETKMQTPQELQQFVLAEAKQWDAVVKSTGIKVD